MSYKLCLGFRSFQFKKAPHVKIFLDDTFLYDFYIKSKISSQFAEHGGIYSVSSFSNEYKNYLSANPIEKNITGLELLYNFKGHNLAPDINLIAIDIPKTDLKKAKKIKINIQSHDNNFTNGFMTNSTLYCLKFAFCVPEEVIDHYKHVWQNFKKILKSTLQQKKQKTSFEQILNYYNTPYFNNHPFNLCPPNFEDKENNERYQVFNKRNKPIEIDSHISTQLLGGVKNIEIDLTKNFFPKFNHIKYADEALRRDYIVYDMIALLSRKFAVLRTGRGKK